YYLTRPAPLSSREENRGPARSALCRGGRRYSCWIGACRRRSPPGKDPGRRSRGLAHGRAGAVWTLRARRAGGEQAGAVLPWENGGPAEVGTGAAKGGRGMRGLACWFGRGAGRGVGRRCPRVPAGFLAAPGRDRGQGPETKKPHTGPGG